MSLRFGAALLLLLSVVFAAGRSDASMTKSHSWEEIEDLAAASTHVVRGRFVRWEKAASDAAYRRPNGAMSVPDLYDNLALARVRVEAVLAGGTDVAGMEIVVIDSSKSAIEDIARTGAVFFLRRDGARFWPVSFGVFPVDGANVALATWGRATLPLSELATKARAVTPIRIVWKPSRVALATTGDALEVVFIAKNEGRVTANVLPPSRCDSVKAYPLESDGFWHASKERWFELPRDWFGALDEPAVSLPAGREHTFAYAIPLTSLKMSAPGRYDVVLGMTESFCRAPLTTPDAGPSAMRVLPSYVSDRVFRIEVPGATASPARAVPSVPEDASAQVAAPLATGSAPPRSGCAGCSAAPRDARSTWLAAFVGLSMWRGRRREHRER